MDHEHDEKKQLEQQKLSSNINSLVKQNLRESRPLNQKLCSPIQDGSLSSGCLNPPKQITDSRGYSPHDRIEMNPHKFASPSLGEVKNTDPSFAQKENTLYS